MLNRVLEPEVMDTAEEAADYNAMDHSEVNRRFVDDLLAMLPSDWLNRPRRLLDVGTGTAQIPIELAGRHKNVSILGIDLAEEMLRLGRTNVATAGLDRQIELALVDAKQTDLGDAAFDGVISNSIIHHIPEPGAAFAEMLRVLRPGGFVFVRDLLRPDSEAEVEHLVTTYAADESPRQQQLFRQSLQAALTVDEVADLIEPFGVSRTAVKQISDRHWTLAAP